MARVLAIDFGLKRTGLAVTDELQIIANGLTTVSSVELMSFLEKYLQREKVECFVIGMPKKLSGEYEEIAKNIELLADELRKKFLSVEIVFVDERFTSKIAFRSMIDSGLKKKKRRNKALVDEVSATVILQSYLERKGNFI